MVNVKCDVRDVDKDPYYYFRYILKSPKLIVAPMVDQSECAWRMLSRKYGAQLCFTPMQHAAIFARDERYRREGLSSCAEDRPLIVQFCCNDANTFLAAAKLCVGLVDGVDLNLGCPQVIAKRGHYGAYLQDEWDLIREMVSLVHRELPELPISCKIRVFPDIEKTVRYAKMLEEAGCQMLTVHGRTRDQKGALTGIASWAHIKAVKANLRIPVIANGNIQHLSDVDRCISETGVDGVMSAEGNLHNPAIFRSLNPPVWEMAEEYLGLVKVYPCPLSYIRGHLFKIFKQTLTLPGVEEIREKLAKGSKIQDFEEMVKELKEWFVPYVSGEDTLEDDRGLPLPCWLCQPYIRPPPKPPCKREAPEPLREEGELSKRKIKKLLRNPRKCFTTPRSQLPICEGKKDCPNPKNGKCSQSLCKPCCRAKCMAQALDCPAHRVWEGSKKRRAMAEVASDPEQMETGVGGDTPTTLLVTSEAPGVER
ncbi:unnamed protein product [Cyprideis torosa]|uniref:tRNA-dihydrouridine(16/17) synthase [NAD(P)(+)] n=1 Tax=Cyprideis torosa TaxID=163714 RepID=A0A7R8W757_9CRUS|nr:unnamed protein product [Cyprideis torosa]CAG0882031.1 unnamed protein product [Cyprideis torosa]